MMEIRFWGVRGSIPAPGAHTLEFGGNTSCVEVRCGGQRIIFDAGTGIRLLGNAIKGKGPLDAHLFLTHTHWDHIQGLPFFTPAFIPGGQLRIYCVRRPGPGVEELLAGQMASPYFPVGLDAFQSTLTFADIADGAPVVLGEDVRVTPAALNHPDRVAAFRVDHGGRSVVFATDTEHYSCADPRLTKLARGADVLIHDAQYWAEEYAGEVGMPRVGWGHSTVDAAAEQARACGVGQLVLFHHDPDRDDDGVRALEAHARTLFPASSAAREGQCIALPEAVAA